MSSTLEARDTIALLLAEVAQIHWASLKGAYGASDASDHYRDMPGMFTKLATVHDTDASDWGDAYDDALLAHAWHQYRLYPVTPRVTEFVIRLTSLRVNSAPSPAQQLALALCLIAESTDALRNSRDLAARTLGEATTQVLVDQRERFRSWLTTPLHAQVQAIAGFVPELDL